MRENKATAKRAILDEGCQALAAAGVDTARLDADVLLAHACGVSRAALAASGTVSLEAVEKFGGLITRRASREPLAYILGHKEFFSLDFEVTPAVLIPRPETESLVEAALKFVAARRAARVLDLGTGSGAIAIAIAVNAPDASVLATDISPVAIEIARRNAIRNRCAERVEFVEADLFPDGDALFDLIVSNPPYVAERDVETLAPELRYEPRAALTDRGDGLAFYRRIASGSRAHLNPGGAVMVEIGAGQGRSVEALFQSAGFGNIDAMTDLARIERVIRARIS